MADTTPERLHHYTSLSSLAYILDSRKIRFTRLDQLDDVLEAQKVERFNFGEVLYASSWVANAEEAYPQWSMYGDAMRGVRVSLPYYPFDCHNYIPVAVSYTHLDVYKRQVLDTGFSKGGRNRDGDGRLSVPRRHRRARIRYPGSCKSSRYSERNPGWRTT